MVTVTLAFSIILHPPGGEKNIIKGLVDDHGTRHEDGNTMRLMVYEYFSHLFQSEVHEVNDEAEDIRHILFSCSRAQEIWSSLGVWQYIERLLMMDRSGSVLIQEIIRNGGEESDLKVGRAELILTGCWYIWWQRRQLVHGEVIQIPARAIDCSYCDKLCGCNTEIDCKQSRLAEAFRGMFDDQH